MATITLNYNTRNLQAQNALNYVLSTGWFVETIEKKYAEKRRVSTISCRKIKKTRVNLTETAMLDAINGDVIVCGSYENYLKATEKYA